MDSIIIWGTTVVTFLIGYAVGRNAFTKETLTQTISTVKKAVQKELPVGTLKRPTADDINRRQNPKRVEEEEIMKETFAKLLEEE